MGNPINCLIPDDLFKKLLDRKSKMQKKTTKNISLTDAVIDVLEDGFRY